MLTFDLDNDRFSGGIAVWSAISPVLETTSENCMMGIHVHARRSNDNPKTIDVTTDKFKLILDGRETIITEKMAFAYRVCRVLDIPMKTIRCLNCDALQFDSVRDIPHRKSKKACNNCGKEVAQSRKFFANPLSELQERFFKTQPKTVDSRKRLNIDPKNYSGGVRIWGTAQAILWSSNRAEESGIHVHAYDSQMRKVIDDTYGEVWYGDTHLPVRQVQLYTIQKSIKSLNGKICCLSCTHCKKTHLDDGEFAIRKHTIHLCEHCGKKFSSQEGSNVSNYAQEIFESLKTETQIN
jgi:hypothetical protein